MIAVVDTSAFLRLFIPDGDIPHGLEAFFRGVERGDNMAIAPELMLAEAGNVVNKKRCRGLLTSQESGGLVRLMRSMPVRYISHGDLIMPAIELAESHTLTVYDALFLALAQKQNVRMFTADEHLARTAAGLGLS